MQLNVRLEADVSKLSKQLAAAHSEDGSNLAELVHDMSANSTRLSNDKQMVRTSHGQILLLVPCEALHVLHQPVTAAAEHAIIMLF